MSTRYTTDELREIALAEDTDEAERQKALELLHDRDELGCSNPWCHRDAEYLETATNAGDATGKKFLTCEKHNDGSGEELELETEVAA